VGGCGWVGGVEWCVCWWCEIKCWLVGQDCQVWGQNALWIKSFNWPSMIFGFSCPTTLAQRAFVEGVASPEIDLILVGLARTIHTYVYTMYIRHFWQGKYGHIRCTYTVLANPRYWRSLVPLHSGWFSLLMFGAISTACVVFLLLCNRLSH